MATSSAWRGRVWQEPINEYGKLNAVSEFNQGYGECTLKNCIWIACFQFSIHGLIIALELCSRNPFSTCEGCGHTRLYRYWVKAAVLFIKLRPKP